MYKEELREVAQGLRILSQKSREGSFKEVMYNTVKYDYKVNNDDLIKVLDNFLAFWLRSSEECFLRTVGLEVVYIF